VGPGGGWGTSKTPVSLTLVDVSSFNIKGESALKERASGIEAEDCVPTFKVPSVITVFPFPPLFTVFSDMAMSLRVSLPCSNIPILSPNFAASSWKPSLLAAPVTLDSIKRDFVPLCIAIRLAEILSLPRRLMMSTKSFKVPPRKFIDIFSSPTVKL